MRPLLAGAAGSRRQPEKEPQASLRPLHRCGGGPGKHPGMNRMAVWTNRFNQLAPREVGMIVAALALLADQGSKLFMLYGAGFARMFPGQSVAVLPFFNLVMVWKP